MPSLDLLGFDMPQSMGWASPTVGVLVVSLTILAGRLLRSKLGAGLLAASPKQRLSLRDPFVHGSCTERRQTGRRKGNHVKEFVVNAAGDHVGKSWVLDRSATGLLLQVKQALEVGTILNLLPCDAPSGTRPVPVEVKNCRTGEFHWQLGCQFVRPPVWSVLLLFG